MTSSPDERADRDADDAAAQPRPDRAAQARPDRAARARDGSARGGGRREKGAAAGGHRARGSAERRRDPGFTDRRRQDRGDNPRRGAAPRDRQPGESQRRREGGSFDRTGRRRQPPGGDRGRGDQRTPARPDRQPWRSDRPRGPRRDAGRREESVAETAAPVEKGPPIPDEIEPTDLHHEVRAELRALSKSTADTVARRLVAVAELLEVAPQDALAHALAARKSASRIGAVREAAGIAAYHAGEWKLAISELRAYQRISGRQSYLAVIADCERALGRPERAVDLYRTADQRQLDRAEAAELLIVAAGARRDLGQTEAAAAMLQVPGLRTGPAASWVARLRYAYADTLVELGRTDEAREWFRRAMDADPDGETGAAERLLDLEGVVLQEPEDLPVGDDEE